MDKERLKEQHSFINDFIFQLKTFVLTANRAVGNFIKPTPKFKVQSYVSTAPILSFSESELWNPHDNKDNWILTAGKIQNLRISAKKLNGLEIKANEVFSFWRHIGNPNYGKGYVIGREIREGCIVPTIAGGLCQLSNALYDAALKANFEIIERHKHTKVIKGSLAERDRDATVKWNYIDLRFKSTCDFRIEIELTSNKLIVYFKGNQINEFQTEKQFKVSKANILNDCYSCGNIACYKHPKIDTTKQNIAVSTFILDENWSEYDNYVQEIVGSSDYFILPFTKKIRVKTPRYNWKSANAKSTKTTDLQSLYRALMLRFMSKTKNNIFELTLQLDKKIALAAVNKIPIQTTHIVVSQNLLPFLYESGALGGRTFDVLMTRLPFEKLHERLDLAFLNHSESPTLKDYRAKKELVELENKALTQARFIVTPHTEIAEIFKNKVVKLNWHVPNSTNKQSTGKKILFPASALGRKGAYELRKLATEFPLKLVILGSSIEENNFWGNIQIEEFNGDLNQIGFVIYPTYVENQPRQILKAISKGIPIITTKACGIAPCKQVQIIELNEFELWQKEVKNRVEGLNQEN